MFDSLNDALVPNHPFFFREQRNPKLPELKKNSDNIRGIWGSNQLKKKHTIQLS